MLEQLRRTDIENPVTQEMINSFSNMILTSEDVLNEPRWKFAPAAVCSNTERAAINHDQAKRFAQYHGHKVIQWHLPLILDDTFTSQHTIDQIYHEKASVLTFTFVYGAPAYLTENMNPLKGVVNGSPCTFHSLYWKDPNVATQMLSLINNTPLGQVVMLPIPPNYVNVQLNGRPNCSSDSLVGNTAYVIPVPVTSTNKVDIKFGRKKYFAKNHAVELGFAITYHKLQGKTLDLLILNPYSRGCKPELTLMALLVGLSRVRYSRNVRFLPPLSNSEASPFKHLMKFKSKNDFRIWWAGFNVDNNGQWDLALSRQAEGIGQARVRLRTTVTERERNSVSRGVRRRATTQSTANSSTQPGEPTHDHNVTENEVLPMQIGQNLNNSHNNWNNATASPFFVPFLNAVAGFTNHPDILPIQNYINGRFESNNLLWDVMIRRIKFVHQYVLENGDVHH
jgi:hypothetical protein